MSIILQVAIPSPLRNTFDYLPPEDQGQKIEPGMRVLVPFGKQKLIGFVHAVTATSEIAASKLKAILSVLDNEPLIPKSIMELINWTAEYYHHPLGDVFANAIPSLLREERKKPYIYSKLEAIATQQANAQSKINLNQEQQHSLSTIEQHLHEFKTFLLDGVTNSGKTEIYLQTISKICAAGKQALVLVPEINLTPQTIARFQERFALPIAVIHSKLTPQERLRSWFAAKNNDAAIIIGTRSAIFTPMQNPGIIILDEEHDLSFKQQSGLRYNARDLANVRGKIENIPIILGSATPSLESVHNVKRHRYFGLSLPHKVGKAPEPKFHLVDMRSQKLQDGIAENLFTAIEKHLASNGQVLVFLNRRGFAPVLLCHECGWNANCKNCDAHMTLHQKTRELHCHHCDTIKRIPIKCPTCGSSNLVAIGVGTEKLELALQTHFPQAKLIRIDRDTTRRKGSLQKMLGDIQNNNCQILIGTQMLAKGHHFPDVTLVAVLNVDNSLFSSDFRASEHLAQLIMQVSGRAGRAEKPGEIYLQTHNPQHPLLLKLITSGYASFAREELQERDITELPPFTHLAIIRAESKTQDTAIEFLRGIRGQVISSAPAKISVFGPIPAVMERKSGFFRAQLLLQSTKRNVLHQTIRVLLEQLKINKPASNIKWHIDIDPQELM